MARPVPVWVGPGCCSRSVSARCWWACSRPLAGIKRELRLRRDPAVSVHDVYAAFAGQGAALAIAFACHVRGQVALAVGRAYRRGRREARQSGCGRGRRLTSRRRGGRCRDGCRGGARLFVLGGRRLVRVLRLGVGSGAVAAFDGLSLVPDQFFLVFGTDASVPGWSLTDTVMVIKVVIGALAAAVGALAVIAAAKDTVKPAAGRQPQPPIAALARRS